MLMLGNLFYLIIGEVDEHTEVKNESKCLVFDSLKMKTEKYYKNAQNFGMGLKMKLRQ